MKKKAINKSATGKELEAWKSVQETTAKQARCARCHMWRKVGEKGICTVCWDEYYLGWKVNFQQFQKSVENWERRWLLMEPGSILPMPSANVVPATEVNGTALPAPPATLTTSSPAQSLAL